MSTALHIVAACLYGLVGVVALVMAAESLRSPRFMSFHEGASGTQWAAIDYRLQAVILALLRQSGLGFLLTGLLLFVGAVATLASLGPVAEFAPPLLGLVFCSSLFVVNRRLGAATGAATPARESLFAGIAIFAGLVLSLAASLLA